MTSFIDLLSALRYPYRIVYLKKKWITIVGIIIIIAKNFIIVLGVVIGFYKLKFEAN